MAHLTEQKKMHPGDIRKVLASAHQRGGKTPTTSRNDRDYVIVNGKKYISANIHLVEYRVSTRNVIPNPGALIDRGANGGIAGDDVLLLETTSRTCNVTGIDDHKLHDLPIGTCAGLVRTHLGPIIVLLHQYAYSGKGKTIHSSAQIEHFGNDVNDKSTKVRRGKQRIVTLDGYIIPIHIRNGLPYIDMSKPSSEDLDTYPHVVLTSDVDWNPECLDCEFDLDEWSDAVQTITELPPEAGYNDLAFDEHGLYRQRKVHNVAIDEFFDAAMDPLGNIEDVVDDLIDNMQVHKRNININHPSFKDLRPNFGWAPVDVIQKTFQCTTQWARSIERYPFRKHFKSRFLR